MYLCKKENNFFWVLYTGHEWSEYCVEKIRIIHYLRTRMKQQMNHLILWSIHTKKNLINEYILSHLFPHNAKIQVNAVDVRVIKV